MPSTSGVLCIVLIVTAAVVVHAKEAIVTKKASQSKTTPVKRSLAADYHGGGLGLGYHPYNVFPSSIGTAQFIAGNGFAKPIASSPYTGFPGRIISSGNGISYGLTSGNAAVVSHYAQFPRAQLAAAAQPSVVRLTPTVAPYAPYAPTAVTNSLLFAGFNRPSVQVVPNQRPIIPVAVPFAPFAPRPQAPPQQQFVFQKPLASPASILPSFPVASIQPQIVPIAVSASQYPTQVFGPYPSQVASGQYPSQVLNQYPTQQIPQQFPVQQIPQQFPVQQIPQQFPVQQIPQQFPVQQIPQQFPVQQIPQQYPTQQYPTQQSPQQFPTQQSPQQFPIDSGFSFERPTSVIYPTVTMRPTTSGFQPILPSNDAGYRPNRGPQNSPPIPSTIETQSNGAGGFQPQQPNLIIISTARPASNFPTQTPVHHHQHHDGLPTSAHGQHDHPLIVGPSHHHHHHHSAASPTPATVYGPPGYNPPQLQRDQHPSPSPSSSSSVGGRHQLAIHHHSSSY